MHSLPRRLARQQKRVQRAIRRPTIRAAQNQRSGVERLPSVSKNLQSTIPSLGPSTSFSQSLPSRYDRSPLFSFSLHIFPQPSPLCLSEIPIPSFPRSQPPPKWLSPSRTSGLKSPWLRKFCCTIPKAPVPRPRRPVPLATGALPALPASPVNTTNSRRKKKYHQLLSPPADRTTSNLQHTPEHSRQQCPHLIARPATRR